MSVIALNQCLTLSVVLRRADQPSVSISSAQLNSCFAVDMTMPNNEFNLSLPLFFTGPKGEKGEKGEDGQVDTSSLSIDGGYF